MALPGGGRAEFEGFVAALDPAESAFLHRFVEASPTVLPLLPYPPVYERNTFLAPSYNAVNILTYCSSMHFSGLNLPNFDFCRNTVGFKNLSLLNMINAYTPTAASFPFLVEEVMPAVIAFTGSITLLHIAGHELYGHGSGTLLTEKDVTENEVPDLLVPGARVTTFYREGENYHSVFGDVNQAYEECRAETTGLHLTFKDEVLDLYGVAPGDRQTFKHVAVLRMAHAALRGLVEYSPEAARWTQAHARGRFAILRAMLRWSEGAVTVQKIGETFKIVLDEAKFEKVQEAVATLLKHLSFYKAARRGEEGREFFKTSTEVDEYWLEVRKQSAALPRGNRAEIGAVVRKTGEGFTLERAGGETHTLLDAALSVVESIQLALE